MSRKPPELTTLSPCFNFFFFFNNFYFLCVVFLKLRSCEYETWQHEVDVSYIVYITCIKDDKFKVTWWLAVQTQGFKWWKQNEQTCGNKCFVMIFRKPLDGWVYAGIIISFGCRLEMFLFQNNDTVWIASERTLISFFFLSFQRFIDVQFKTGQHD